MDDRFNFNFYTQEPELDSMDRETLLEYWSRVREQMGQLDAQEPEDMDSEEYEVWGERREELEDLADEILDRLDELGGPHGGV